MEEENKQEPIEKLEDDGKIHFPVAGLIISGVLLLMIISLVVIILVLRGQSNG